MAKRMKFTVVGLPHYTVWHLYEPSVDDLRHMEEMENERKAREAEEKERADRLKKIKEEFNEPNSQWEQDKNELKTISDEDEAAGKKEDAGKKEGGDEQGPIAHTDKESPDGNDKKEGEGDRNRGEERKEERKEETRDEPKRDESDSRHE